MVLLQITVPPLAAIYVLEYRLPQVFSITAAKPSTPFHPRFRHNTDPRSDPSPRFPNSSASMSTSNNLSAMLSSITDCDISFRPTSLILPKRSLARMLPKLPLESLPCGCSLIARLPISIDLPVCSTSSRGMESRGGASEKLSSSTTPSSIAIENLGCGKSSPSSKSSVGIWSGLFD